MLYDQERASNRSCGSSDQSQMNIALVDLAHNKVGRNTSIMGEVLRLKSSYRNARLTCMRDDLINNIIIKALS